MIIIIPYIYTELTWNCPNCNRINYTHLTNLDPIDFPCTVSCSWCDKILTLHANLRITYERGGYGNHTGVPESQKEKGIGNSRSSSVEQENSVG